MAQGDLLKLIKKAEKYIGKDTEWYRSFLDLETHQFTMTLPSVLEAICGEIGNETYAAYQTEITRLCKNYISEVYSIFIKKREVTLNFNGDENGFTVTLAAKKHGTIGAAAYKPTKEGPQLYYPTSGTNVFRHINDAKRGPQQKLVAGLNALIRSDKPLSSTNFIDTGHDIGVAEKQTKTALGEFSAAVAKKPSVAEIVARDARLSILSKVERGSKKFVISVTEESAKQNRSKATQEKEFKERTLIVLRQFIADNKDWAKQGGSDSQVDYMRKTIINSVIDNGGKGKKQKLDTKSSQVSNKIKGRTSTTRSDNQESLKVKAPQAPQNPISLMNLLNLRLTPNVKEQMVKPALVNRTGKFAESVKVVNIRRSAQGYLTIEYDYDRAPYDVFDPVLGAKPWATPARDPKKIIDRAIRVAARGIITERFYNRRIS